jgi:hypothetical protein
MDPSPWRESVHVIAELLRGNVISRTKIYTFSEVAVQSALHLPFRRVWAARRRSVLTITQHALVALYAE